MSSQPPFPPCRILPLFLFFFNDTATTEIYTLSLHDALPIYRPPRRRWLTTRPTRRAARPRRQDRKSTRLNSSHVEISYAVFCLKKKNNLQILFLLAILDLVQLRLGNVYVALFAQLLHLRYAA